MYPTYYDNVSKLKHYHPITYYDLQTVRLTSLVKYHRFSLAFQSLAYHCISMPLDLVHVLLVSKSVEF